MLFSIICRRTVANEACDAGRVTVNGRPAKASAEVKVGDVIEIGFGNKAVKVQVTDIKETTKKDEAKEMFTSFSSKERTSRTPVSDSSLHLVIARVCSPAIPSADAFCSFDENEVKMDTSCGILLIRGEGLHVKSLVLEKGEARVEGKVESLQYQEEKGFVKKGESVFSRLFG